MSLASCKKGQYGGNTEAIRPSRHDHMLFTENSLIHVRKLCILIQRAHDLNAFSLQEDVPNTIGLFFHLYYVKQSYQHCLTKKVDSVVKTNKLT